MGQINIRQLPSDQLSRLAEIDRTEEIPEAYFMVDGRLELREVGWRAGVWDADGDFSVAHYVEQFGPMLEAGGVLLGAFEGDTLAGLGVLRYKLTLTMAQLALLHVSREYRGQGVGKMLVQEMFRLAREDGARQLYVSSIPSKNSVDFYRSQGFELTPEPHLDLFALEPEDIHMVCRL
jgi:GNAT superfamily N-acetyltransferase